MTAALAIVSDDGSASLSPARRVLAEHLAAVAQAQSDLGRASHPVERLREQVCVAGEQLADAEADLAAIDARHAAAIRDQAKNGATIELGKPSASAKAEAAVEAAQRTCNAVRAALADCEADANAASKVLRAKQAQTDALILAVMEEEFATALARRNAAGAAFVVAEAELWAIRELFGARGRGLEADTEKTAWLRAGERARSVRIPVMEATLAEIQAATDRWLAALTRMSAGDATASGS